MNGFHIHALQFMGWSVFSANVMLHWHDPGVPVGPQLAHFIVAHKPRNIKTVKAELKKNKENKTHKLASLEGNLKARFCYRPKSPLPPRRRSWREQVERQVYRAPGRWLLQASESRENPFPPTPTSQRNLLNLRNT